MTRNDRIKFRRVALLLLGLAFALAVWPLGILGMSGGVWNESGRAAYLESIRGLHAAVSLPEDRLP